MTEARVTSRQEGPRWWQTVQDRLPSWWERALAIALIAFAVILPFFFLQANKFVDVTTQALAYVVMALGLNIVVGFAGLLDLGYAAFFAFGAYTIGWFSSGFISNAHIHFGSAGPLATLPGIHPTSSSW